MKYDVCRSELMILSGASAPCIVLFLIAEAGSLMHFPDAGDRPANVQKSTFLRDRRQSVSPMNISFA
jgi:hypothetical protein